MGTHVYRLEATAFGGPARWTWRLHGPDGEPLAEHDVELDTASWQFHALNNLGSHLRLHASPDRRLADEARIVHLLGRWIGEHVFGPIGAILVGAGLVSVRVIIPKAAQIIASYPLESAVVDGRALSAQGVVFALTVHDETQYISPRTGRPTGGRLRMLGLFSVPDGSSALNLRKERRELAALADRLGEDAVELTVLQYGVTRERLREVVADPEGWDVVHLSGHGAVGALLLETEQGGPDLIGGGQLVDLLQPLAGRVQFVMLSACSSAALPAAEQLYLLGLGPAPVAPDVADAAEAADVQGPSAPAVEFANRLRCSVLAMRYPVTEEFAAALAVSFYEQALLADDERTPSHALATALPPLITGLPTPGRPPLSIASAALFVPSGDEHHIIARPSTASTPWSTATAAPNPPNSTTSTDPALQPPPPPDHFVGRVALMARVGSSLAPKSGASSTLLQGMAGAGKTACARELAHIHRDEFDDVLWFTIPRESADGTYELAQFVYALEQRFADIKLIHLIRESAESAELPEWAIELTELTMSAASNRILIVLDNADSLVTADGAWREPRWGDLLSALTAHRGRGKLIVTSRNPLPLPGARLEPLHALPRDESVLLARELPHLRTLFGEGGGDVERGQRALAQVLRVAQGHPKLLELADGQAADAAGLARLLAVADTAWQSRGGVPEGYFAEGHASASSQDYAEILAS